MSLYTGVTSNADFSKLTAVVFTGCGYIYHSTDDGNSWTQTDSDEACLLQWNCLAASADAKTLLITDSMTRNVHASAAYGHTWFQVFKASTYKI